MTDAHGPGHLRRQGQAAPDPAADLFPRRVSRTTRRRGSSTRRATSPGTTCPASSRPTWASCARSGSSGRYFNHRGNVTRRSVLIKVSGGPAPRVYAGRARSRGTTPAATARSGRMARTLEAVRTLNDLLGLRDCAADDARGLRRPGRPVRPAAAGGVHAPRVRVLQRAVRRLRVASGTTAGGSRPPMAFLEGRTIQPIDRVVHAMQEAAAEARFEVAARWREKFEQLEWLLAATSRARSARGSAHLRLPRPGRLRRRPGLPRPAGRGARRRFPIPPRRSSTRRFAPWWPRRRPGRPRRPGPLPLEAIDEILLLMAWFRAHPDALRRTTPYAEWAA